MQVHKQLLVLMFLTVSPLKWCDFHCEICFKNLSKFKSRMACSSKNIGLSAFDQVRSSGSWSAELQKWKGEREES